MHGAHGHGKGPGGQGPRDPIAFLENETHKCLGQPRGLNIKHNIFFLIFRSGGVTHGGVTAGGVKEIVSAKCMGPTGPPRALGPMGQRPRVPGAQGPKDPSAKNEHVTHRYLGQPRGVNNFEFLTDSDFSVWWRSPW